MATATLLKKFSRSEIEGLLPHRGDALVIDEAEIMPGSLCCIKGYFALRSEDPRITNHFGILPGVLMAEFAHLTGAILVMHDAPSDHLVVLKSTSIDLFGMAMGGDLIVCHLAGGQVKGSRDFTFSGDISCHDKALATVTFTGTLMPKRLLERLQKNKSLRPLPTLDVA